MPIKGEEYEDTNAPYLVFRSGRNIYQAIADIFEREMLLYNGPVPLAAAEDITREAQNRAGQFCSSVPKTYQLEAFVWFMYGHLHSGTNGITPFTKFLMDAIPSDVDPDLDLILREDLEDCFGYESFGSTEYMTVYQNAKGFVGLCLTRRSTQLHPNPLPIHRLEDKRPSRQQPGGQSVE